MDSEFSENEKQILIFLKQNYPRDFSVQEIAKALQIHENTVRTHLRVLEITKLVKLTRTHGVAKLYCLTDEGMKKAKEILPNEKGVNMKDKNNE